jgi:hypothetical protein
LTEGINRTLYYIAYQLSVYLPEDVRPTYRVLLSKIPSFWERAEK